MHSKAYHNYTPVSSPHVVYCEVFRCRCINLISRGYRRIKNKSLHEKEEPDVTGCLVVSIKEELDAPQSPEWMACFFIADNPPLNVPGKIGKARPQADFEFEISGRRPRTRFRFEAKWVGADKTSLGAKRGYLGLEGIGCFLSGYYPVESNFRHAGMLAYVYSKDETFWAEKIENHMISSSKSLYIRESNRRVWERDDNHDLFYIFISIHDCPKPVGLLHITHILLNFTSG